MYSNASSVRRTKTYYEENMRELGYREKSSRAVLQRYESADQGAITKIQGAIRGYLARVVLGKLELENFENWFEKETKLLRKRIKKVADMVEGRWRLNKISQATEMQAIEKLQLLLFEVHDLGKLKQEPKVNFACPEQIEKHCSIQRKKFGSLEIEFLLICKEVGFSSVKQGLKEICAGKLKEFFSKESLNLIEEYSMLFQPTSFCLYKKTEEQNESFGIFVNRAEELLQVAKVFLKKETPSLMKQTVFTSESEPERWKSARLIVPFTDEYGQQVIAFNGVIKNDPLNASHNFSFVREKKADLQKAFLSERHIPRKFRFDYLSYYPLRDLLLKEPFEIVADLKRDYSYLQKIEREGIKQSTIEEFIRTPIQDQLRIFSILLMDESPRNALFLFEKTAKDMPEYMQLIRDNLHFNLQKKLNLAFLELSQIKKKLEAQKENRMPYETRIAMSSMDEDAKVKAMEKLKVVNSKGHDADKAERYLDSLLSIPFGIFTKEAVTRESEPLEISNYLDEVRNKLDSAVYGAEEAKESVVEWIAQRISNAQSKGECIALEGPPGVGKTTFAREGISKALNRPFAFISMGGRSDSCFLIGHPFTYVGSTWGRIVEILRESKCMDPVIYIDEADKISQTDKGKELIGVLTRLTDFSQNEEFQEDYFSGIDFNLSKALFIFSYNDASLLDPIFKDRLRIIKLEAHTLPEKLVIANKYLIPDIKSSCGFEDNEIAIKEGTLKFLIESYTVEAGVRKLKENLFSIVRKLNLLRLRDPNAVQYPFIIDDEMVLRFRKEPKLEIKKILSKPSVGTVNGLYATQVGIGGLTVVQAFRTLENDRLKLTLTGSQGDVMKESMAVARSVAWNLIPETIKEKIYDSRPEGLHIHCPEGGTPKDGPSAGGAITAAIVSQLIGIPIKNDVAMTGEIDLSGRITKIGGLAAKLRGAKRAGIRLALIPNENKKDLEKLIEKDPGLFDETFKVKLVDTIYDILEEALVNNPIKRPEDFGLS